MCVACGLAEVSRVRHRPVSLFEDVTSVECWKSTGDNTFWRMTEVNCHQDPFPHLSSGLPGLVHVTGKGGKKSSPAYRFSELAKLSFQLDFATGILGKESPVSNS